MTTVPDTTGAPVQPAARPAPATTLSVVVCAYTLERWPDVTAAVDSLRGQTRRPDQLILVSDHNDELLTRARAAFADVTCLANTGAQGLSGARNTGVQAATGDVVAFLDDDAAADPDWAAQLLDAYRDDDVIGVGGAVVPAWQAPRPRWFPEEFLWVVGCSYAGLPEGRSPIRNPIGANMSFRRSVLTTAGGFDATMGRLGKDAAGCEETEFSIRAARVHPGSRIVLEPASRCRHTVSAERVTRGYFRRRCRAEGRSKALVSRLAGPSSALESERAYVRRTLPRGVLRGLRDVLRGDLGGAERMWMIVEGVALTGAGYLTTRLRLARRTAPTG
ncbi:glycosyltransferase family 2 protein [Modestobacter sp. SYSU DS0290]